MKPDHRRDVDAIPPNALAVLKSLRERPDYIESARVRLMLYRRGLVEPADAIASNALAEYGGCRFRPSRAGLEHPQMQAGANALTPRGFDLIRMAAGRAPLSRRTGHANGPDGYIALERGGFVRWVTGSNCHGAAETERGKYVATERGLAELAKYEEQTE
jgi:hypothetical protein